MFGTRAGRENKHAQRYMTHMCLSTSVRTALHRGFKCTIVANACATRDLPDGQGGVVSADVLHRAELAALADRFACVVARAEQILP
jgi:nicotinamidase-related amidase